MEVPGIGRRTAEAVMAAVAQPAADAASEADPTETTVGPDGPAERGVPQPDAGGTAEVGRVDVAGAGRVAGVAS
jgi:excinuclease ABC subunit C